MHEPERTAVIVGAGPTARNHKLSVEFAIVSMRDGQLLVRDGPFAETKTRWRAMTS